MQMLLAHMQTPPTPIQTLCPDLHIPDAIANVVMRCLAKDRDLRPASAKALIEELKLASTGLVPPGDVLVDQSAWESAPTFVTEARPARDSARLAQPREPLPASSIRWGVWTSTAIAVATLVIGGWYFGRGGSGTPGAHLPTAQPQAAAASASQTVTAAQPSPEEKTGESQIGLTLPQSAPSGEQESPQLAVPAANQRVANRSLSTPATTKALVAVAGRSNSIEIEKQVKGAVTEGDFHYENGEYDEAIKSYLEGLKFDHANAALRKRIQRAQKGKATEDAVKQ